VDGRLLLPAQVDNGNFCPDESGPLQRSSGAGVSVEKSAQARNQLDRRRLSDKRAK